MSDAAFGVVKLKSGVAHLEFVDVVDGLQLVIGFLGG